jgi:acyl-CoA synthetase (AMP-forming)/AMP-acid ligase II
MMQFNIADLFESLVAATPNHEVLVCGARRLTFAELDERANRMAAHLHAQGIGRNDHIGFYMHNSAEFIEAMLAALKLRAVPININYRYVESELLYLCQNAHLKGLFFDEVYTNRVTQVHDATPSMRMLVRVGDGASSLGTAYEQAMQSAPLTRYPERSGEDLYIIYTGGTTGMPRGVMWRHEDMFFAGLQGGHPGGEPISRPEELASIASSGNCAMVILPAAPLIHGAAQWGTWIGMFSGGKVVLTEGGSFAPKQVWSLVDHEKVTTLTVVGDAMARPLVDSLRADRKVDTSSLLVMGSAGAILSESTVLALNELLPNMLIVNSFGATETGYQGRAFGDAGASKKHLAFYMDDSNTVLDESTLQPIAPGSGVIGRLARRGHIPVGYYNDPEKTQVTFIHVDGVRWAVPGDLATIESDGRIRVFGRGAVCINTGGEKVFPEEIEEVLKAHPAVHDAVVVGVPDPRWGQRVAAIVELRPSHELTLEAMDAHCRKHIAGYKVPRVLRVVSRVVRHPSGKPDYRWARDMAVEMEVRDAAHR